jgi:hypothetical protein
MAQGSVVTFEEFRKEIGDGTFDLDASAAFGIRLISDTGNLAATATPNIADFTAVTGGTYADKTGLTLTWTETGGTATLSLAADQTWEADPDNGPIDIRKALVYQTTGGAALGYVDMTQDGSTPISLRDGSIVIKSGALFTLS